jgi:hypothetical protein
MRLRQSHRQALLAGILLAAALAIPNAGVLFDGRSLVYTDQYNFLDSRPREENYGPGFVPQSEWQNRNLLMWANQHDAGATWWQWEPDTVLTRSAILGGEFPWWNPYVGAGAPGVTNPTSTTLFPPYFLFILVFGVGSLSKTLYALLVWWAAGFFTFLFLRHHGLRPPAAGIGGLLFSLSGAMTQNAPSILGQSLACLPPLMYVTARFLERPNGRRAIVAAGTYAAAVLAGFAPLLMGGFGAAATYALFCIAWRRRSGASAREMSLDAGRYLGVVGLSMLLASAFLLPLAKLAQASPAGAAYSDASQETLPARNLLQLASPILLGGEKIQAVPWIRAESTAVHVPYVGMVALVLGLAGCRQRSGPSGALLAWALAATCLICLKLIGFAPLQLLATLPILRYVHYVPYFAFLLAFPLAVIAAIGFDGLGSSRFHWTQTCLGTATIAGILFGLRAVAGADGVFDGPSAAAWLGEWWVVVAIAATALVGVAAAAGAVGTRRFKLGVALIALALAFESYRNTWYPRQKRWGIWQHPPKIVAELQARAKGRRIFNASTFEANSGSAFRLHQIESLMTFNSSRVSDFYRLGTGTRNWLHLREPERLPPDGFLSRANIGLVLVSRRNVDVDLEASTRFRRAYRDAFFALYTRPTLPRYFFTSEYRVVDAAAALRRSVVAEPSREIFLEFRPAVPRRANRRPDPAVEVRRQGLNGVDLFVEAPRPGLVYLSESQMPGWTAAVNGKETAILAANYAFRAVEVNAGPNEIVLRYSTPGLALGSLLSALGLLVAGFLCYRPRRSTVEADPST